MPGWEWLALAAYGAAVALVVVLFRTRRQHAAHRRRLIRIGKPLRHRERRVALRAGLDAEVDRERLTELQIYAEGFRLQRSEAYLVMSVYLGASGGLVLDPGVWRGILVGLGAVTCAWLLLRAERDVRLGRAFLQRHPGSDVSRRPPEPPRAP
ncbi:hypothetical protein [Kineosporia succinea]|uniref:Uncharacterized protein n=1 Tax=Kineosporia succinea TaxID=84632 RepID=A0ABT9P8E5_9ACTN|nr:hypothetical protein [Kineosporia succinea]MDP9828966.1 hypothetical protein [Kineosporia succinea]